MYRPPFAFASFVFNYCGHFMMNFKQIDHHLSGLIIMMHTCLFWCRTLFFPSDRYARIISNLSIPQQALQCWQKAALFAIAPRSLPKWSFIRRREGPPIPYAWCLPCKLFHDCSNSVVGFAYQCRASPWTRRRGSIVLVWNDFASCTVLLLLYLSSIIAGTSWWISNK